MKRPKKNLTQKILIFILRMCLHLKDETVELFKKDEEVEIYNTNKEGSVF